MTIRSGYRRHNIENDYSYFFKSSKYEMKCHLCIFKILKTGVKLKKLILAQGNLQACHLKLYECILIVNSVSKKL